MATGPSQQGIAKPFYNQDLQAEWKQKTLIKEKSNVVKCNNKGSDALFRAVLIVQDRSQLQICGLQNLISKSKMLHLIIRNCSHGLEWH